MQEAMCLWLSAHNQWISLEIVIALMNGGIDQRNKVEEKGWPDWWALILVNARHIVGRFRDWSRMKALGPFLWVGIDHRRVLSSFWSILWEWFDKKGKVWGPWPPPPLNLGPPAWTTLTKCFALVSWKVFSADSRKSFFQTNLLPSMAAKRQLAAHRWEINGSGFKICDHLHYITTIPPQYISINFHRKTQT